MAKSRRKEVETEDKLIDINRKKCIGCSACAMACTGITNISVLRTVNDIKRSVTPKKCSFKESGCIYCGQCTAICPTNAMEPTSDINKVREALNNGKYIIAIAAPAVKVTLGEEFRLPIGTDVEGKVQASARKLGFQRVFDSDFGGDITAVEQSHEFLRRMKIRDNLPMFTSACPAWVRWVEVFRPNMIGYLSTVKSPQQIMGTAIKTYYAENFKILPKNIFVVSIEPCTAKKYEAEREDMGRDEYRDIDAVLTVRQYAELLKENSIDITAIASEKSDNYLGDFTASGTAFGMCQGNAKAILRAISYTLNEEETKIDDLEFSPIEGLENSFKLNIKIGNMDIKTAVITSVRDIEKFISTEQWKKYDLVEVTACPGGCINGGGAPKTIKKAVINTDKCVGCGTCAENCPSYAIQIRSSNYAELNKDRCIGCTLCKDICRTRAITIDTYNYGSKDPLEESYIGLRTKALKELCHKNILKCSRENKELNNMYRGYMKEPYGDKAKNLFHSSFTDRSNDINEGDRNKKRR